MSIVLGDLNRDVERFRLTLADDVVMADTLQSLTAALDERPEEDLVVIGPDVQLDVASDVAERYRLERPSLGVILLRRRIEVQSMAEALRSGIREVVPADDAEALLQACTRSLAVSRQLRHLEARAGDAGHGRVVLVFGAKGGCGKTTLATNLAAGLASLDAGRVCLVDLNLEFGDVAIAMQVEPTRTISDALGMQGGLDRDGVRSMVIPVSDRLDVLLAPTQPADAEFVTAGLIEEVLSLLAEMYDYVVIDSPPAFNDGVLKCFDMADTYVLLTALDMLALKNFKVTLDTLDALGYPRARWRVVLNRYDSHVGLTAEDIEHVIGLQIQVRLPSSKDLPASINKGLPLVQDNPKHPFSREVLALAQAESSMSDRASAAATLPASSRRHRLFGHRS